MIVKNPIDPSQQIPVHGGQPCCGVTVSEPIHNLARAGWDRSMPQAPSSRLLAGRTAHSAISFVSLCEIDSFVLAVNADRTNWGGGGIS